MRRAGACRTARGPGRAARLAAASVLLLAAAAAAADEAPGWLRQSVRLDLASAPAGAEAVAPGPARPAAARRLRELAARLRSRAGDGPGVWYERRAVYLGVRSRF